MPNAYDVRPVAITHHPTQRIDLSYGKLPALDFSGYVDGLIALIKELTGIDISSAVDFVESLGEVLGIDFGELVDMLSNIPIVGDIIDIVRKLLGAIPIGSLTATALNLLTAPTFGAGSVSTDTIWMLDLTTSRSGDGSGSVAVTADGTPKALRSGRDRADTIPVASGQTVTAAIFVNHADYVGSIATDPIQIQVVPFIGDVPGDPVTVDYYRPAGPDVAWPGHELSGNYIVGDDVTGVQVRILVTADASAGVLHFDDGSLTQSGKLSADWIDGLPEMFDDVAGRIQVLVDAIVNVFTGDDSLLHNMEDLVAALLNIPFGNIGGVGGPTNIGQSILAFLDNLVGGLVGTPGSGGGLADVFNISKLVSSRASLGSYAWELLGIRNNQPVAGGLLPTGDSNYPYVNANTYLAVTQATSLCITYRATQSAPLGVVSWLGHHSAGITGFYVNIRTIDPVTGARALIHHSPNIVGNLPPGTTPDWVFYELAAPLAKTVSTDYEIQLVPVGGTHYVKGYDTADPIPDHPTAQVKSVAAIRNETTPTTPAASIAKASVTSSTKVMWIETATDTGNAPGHHDPVTVYFTESGSIPIPSFATYIDAIALGAGGGGRQGGSLGWWGEGGHAGRFAPITWVRGVDFDDTTITIDFACGAGGLGGSDLIGLRDGTGTAGGDSTFTLGATTLTAVGGLGGESLRFGGTMVGEGPGMFTWNGEPYAGGVDQNSYGAAGCGPGGGGGGGNWVSFQHGGAGAAGGGWVKFRQDSIEGGGDMADITPPTAPTPTLDDATTTSITVTATGAYD